MFKDLYLKERLGHIAVLVDLQTSIQVTYRRYNYAVDTYTTANIFTIIQRKVLLFDIPMKYPIREQ